MPEEVLVVDYLPRGPFEGRGGEHALQGSTIREDGVRGGDGGYRGGDAPFDGDE